MEGITASSKGCRRSAGKDTDFNPERTKKKKFNSRTKEVLSVKLSHETELTDQNRTEKKSRLYWRTKLGIIDESLFRNVQNKYGEGS